MIKRKLFYAERFLYLDGRKSIRPTELLFPISIKGNIPVEIVQNALNKLQKKHPALRAHIKGKDIIYEDIPVNPIPLRIVERVSDDTWKEEKEKELSVPYDYENGHLARLLWVRSDEISDFVLFGFHVIMDGKSLFLLISEFVALLDDPEKEVKPYLPFTGMKDLLPNISLTWKEKLGGYIWTEILRWKIFWATFNKKEQPTGKQVHYSIAFDENQLDLLKAKTKSYGTSIGNIQCILALKILQEHFHPEKTEGFLFMSLDMRRYIPALKKDMMFAFAPMLRLKIDLPKDCDLWERSRALGDMIMHDALKIQNSENNSIRTSFVRGLVFIEYYNRIIKSLIKRSLTLDEGQDFTFLNLLGSMNFQMKKSTYEFLNCHDPEVLLKWKNSNAFAVIERRCAFFWNEKSITKEKMEQIGEEFRERFLKLIDTG
ncbi:MAG: condensation domain-containing protein [Candidatus Symbiothrix sp.]|jgi:hypothetical protein|nr:condensation domain-containing protein [Candidatus Symbiothrix sp.]